MRQFAFSLLLAAWSPAWPFGARFRLRVPGMPWAPTEPYITVGQDEPGYRNWFLASQRAPRR